MNRIGVFIFSAYLIAIALYPCTDQEDHGLNDAPSVVAANDKPGTANDHCSPLCICSCCASIDQPPAWEVPIAVEFTHNTIFKTPYRQSELFSNGQRIWQPPRVATLPS